MFQRRNRIDSTHCGRPDSSRKERMGVAESCTGGLIGAACTSLARQLRNGSSAAWSATADQSPRPSCWAYPQRSSSLHGSVSEAVAGHMAQRACWPMRRWTGHWPAPALPAPAAAAMASQWVPFGSRMAHDGKLLRSLARAVPGRPASGAPRHRAGRAGSTGRRGRGPRRGLNQAPRSALNIRCACTSATLFTRAGPTGRQAWSALYNQWACCAHQVDQSTRPSCKRCKSPSAPGCRAGRLASPGGARHFQGAGARPAVLDGARRPRRLARFATVLRDACWMSSRSSTLRSMWATREGRFYLLRSLTPRGLARARRLKAPAAGSRYLAQHITTHNESRSALHLLGRGHCVTLLTASNDPDYAKTL